MIDKPMLAYLAMLVAIVVIALIAAILSYVGAKDAAIQIVATATGLIGVLKMPSWAGGQS